ncbi:MAG: VanZ family protein [Angustibacter sp.]
MSHRFDRGAQSGAQVRVRGGRSPSRSDAVGALDAGRSGADVLRTPESWANVALFIPAGAILAMRWHGWLVWGALTTSSAVIELTQSILTMHSCTGVDLAANSLGVLVGILLSVSIKTVSSRRRRTDNPAASNAARLSTARDLA